MEEAADRRYWSCGGTSVRVACAKIEIGTGVDEGAESGPVMAWSVRPSLRECRVHALCTVHSRTSRGQWIGRRDLLCCVCTVTVATRFHSATSSLCTFTRQLLSGYLPDIPLLGESDDELRRLICLEPQALGRVLLLHKFRDTFPRTHRPAVPLTLPWFFPVKSTGVRRWFARFPRWLISPGRRESGHPIRGDRARASDNIWGHSSAVGREIVAAAAQAVPPANAPAMGANLQGSHAVHHRARALRSPTASS